MSRKIKTAILFIALFLLSSVAYLSVPALADTVPCGDSCATNGGPSGVVNKDPVDCPSGRVDPADPSKCAPLGNDCNGLTNNQCLQKNPITKNLNNLVNFLSAGVGIVVIGVIILGGIQYSIAGDNATATGAAKQRIINGLIALAAFLFLFAFLQWLIPGGI
jgi:hypothetical protein